MKTTSIYPPQHQAPNWKRIEAIPRSAENTCKVSTPNSPEFTWEFLSTSERYPTAKPLVIYINASSEQEVRTTMPSVNLILVARLQFHAFQVMEVRHA